MCDNHFPQARPLSTYAKAALTRSAGLRPGMFIALLLSALGFQLSAQTNATRLHFGYDAPTISEPQALLMTNFNQTYYSVLTTNQAPKNLIPVSTVSNMPLGALQRTVAARVMYFSGSGSATLCQYYYAKGAVRFYRAGVQVGEIPYNTGPTVDTARTNLGMVEIQPHLFDEYPLRRAWTAGASGYRGAQMELVTDSRLQSVGMVYNGSWNSSNANGLITQTVNVDADTAKFIVDEFRVEDAVFAVGGKTPYPCAFFLSILSQPK
jgi:hypothetical protein